MGDLDHYVPEHERQFRRVMKESIKGKYAVARWVDLPDSGLREYQAFIAERTGGRGVQS